MKTRIEKMEEFVKEYDFWFVMITGGIASFLLFWFLY